MKLLVIGGTGVLSLAIVKEALANGLEVSILNRGKRLNVLPNGVMEFFQTDVRDEKRVRSLLKNSSFDAVIDCVCFTEKQLIYSYNLFSSFAKQYVFISSCAVYNTKECSYCTEESSKRLPIWKYSIDKCNCEDALMRLAKEKHGIYTIIRPCVTYDNTRIPYGITPPYGYHWTLISRILNNKPVIRWNKGVNRCNIMRVEDFSVGVIGLLGNKLAYNEAFNVVGDETPSWNDVLSTLEELLGKKAIIIDIPSEFYAEEIPSKKGEILGGRSIDSINSNKKICAIVPKFKQTVFLKEGIGRTIEYYSNNNFIYGIDYAFDAETDRIICKYAQKHNLQMDDLKLKYIDYFHENKLNDKLVYFCNRNSDLFLVKILIFFKKVFIKIYSCFS